MCPSARKPALCFVELRELSCRSKPPKDSHCIGTSTRIEGRSRSKLHQREGGRRSIPYTSLLDVISRAYHRPYVGSSQPSNRDKNMDSSNLRHEPSLSASPMLSYRRSTLTGTPVGARYQWSSGLVSVLPSVYRTEVPSNRHLILVSRCAHNDLGDWKQSSVAPDR